MPPFKKLPDKSAHKSAHKSNVVDRVRNERQKAMLLVEAGRLARGRSDNTIAKGRKLRDQGRNSPGDVPPAK